MKSKAISCLVVYSIITAWTIAGTGCKPYPTYRGKAKILVSLAPFSTSLAEAKGKMPKVRVLATTPSYPSQCLVKYPDTDPDLVERVKAALVRLDFTNPSHRLILEKLRISGFVSTSPQGFNDFRDQLISHRLLSPESNSSSGSGKSQ